MASRTPDTAVTNTVPAIDASTGVEASVTTPSAANVSVRECATVNAVTTFIDSTTAVRKGAGSLRIPLAHHRQQRHQHEGKVVKSREQVKNPLNDHMDGSPEAVLRWRMSIMTGQ